LFATKPLRCTNIRDKQDWFRLALALPDHFARRSTVTGVTPAAISAAGADAVAIIAIELDDAALWAAASAK
jgi:hypothetical protein